jgi:hypothetical protein
LSSGIAIPFESSVDDIGSCVDEIWHDWLVLRTIPWNVSWLSKSVSVAGLVILMEDWSLSCSPFSVGIWDRWVLGKNPGDVPPKEVRVVHQGSGVEVVVVHHQWSLISQTSSESLGNKEYKPGVGQPASNIKVLNWKLSNN